MSKKSITDEINEQKTRGVLLILTGPTGAGKDTLFAALKEKNPTIQSIITTSSRVMRENESDGKPYHFITRSEFEKKIANGDFFEWVEFRGALYGTEKKILDMALSSGSDVMWHIDTKGVKNIKEKVKAMTKRCVFVFLTAKSIDLLEARVRKDEGKNLHRWNEALVKWEMEQFDDCDYLVVNNDGHIDKAVSMVSAIIEAKRMEIIAKS